MLVVQHVASFETSLMAHHVFKATLINVPSQLWEKCISGGTNFFTEQKPMSSDCSWFEHWISRKQFNISEVKDENQLKV